MSYDWIRQRKNYLTFRYLFPEIVAPWIQFKRGILRVVWFFTHPIDEFFETIGEVLAWPFIAVATVCSWMSAGIREFFDDLFGGIEAFFNYIGRLPVWTGAAIAGTLGVILTIMLFFLPLMNNRPVTASISNDSYQKFETQQQSMWVPPTQPQPAAAFDPWAGAAAVQQPQSLWRPQPTHTPSASPRPPTLSVNIDRLRVPYGWDSTKTISVVSTDFANPPQARWSQYERMNAMNGWSLTRIDHARAIMNFTPYVSRRGVRAENIAPSWVTTANQVSPYQPIVDRRQPGVSITKTAPMTAAVGGTVRYELIVANTSNEPLEGVTVREAISAIDRVMDVDPPANVVGQELVWNLSNLQPGERRRMTYDMRPNQLRPVLNTSIVQVTTGVAAAVRVTPQMQQAPPITPDPPRSNITFTPPPRIEPKPASQLPQKPAQDVGMILPGFNKPTPPKQALPKQEEPLFTFDPAPAEPVRQSEPLHPKQPSTSILPFGFNDDEGSLSLTPPATIETQHATETTLGEGKVPYFFEMQTPHQTVVENAVATQFEVRNTGPNELTDVVIQVEFTGELSHARGRILEHHVGRIAPGGVYRTKVTTTAVTHGTAHVRSRLVSAEELDSTLEAEVEIEIDDSEKPPTQLTLGQPEDAPILPSDTEIY